MSSKSTRTKILMKDIPVVSFSPGEYERYCEIFASIQNKNGGKLFQNGLLLCRQNTFVHQKLLELCNNENDKKVLRAAYDYCNNQREPKIKNKNTMTINNVIIKNEVDHSGSPETKGLNKNESTCSRNSLSETACPRNNLLRKISFFIMIFIIIGLFLYAIKYVKDKESRIKELEASNQRKQDKYDKLSFEYNKMIEKSKTENDKY
ncbi:hypothetical protein C2G38_2314347 [Gigaspora rosea]|uniref:Uncharacterized protein n=1 Tax=Gigaspora rosea TaxID=44941 RepID=A0A397VBF1_9GLOM|nr:hypothetical protein C2G38_2314347 [Gigaspora rosea]